jgi:hypothetical protein
MSKREHGYHVLIPAFIPVDKKSLQNQIKTGTVIHEAAQTRDLAAIMALPGIRYHAQKSRDGSVKEMAARWGSVEVETAEEQTPEETAKETAEDEAYSAQPSPGDTLVDEPDAVTTNGRRRRS